MTDINRLLSDEEIYGLLKLNNKGKQRRFTGVEMYVASLTAKDILTKVMGRGK